MPILLKILGIKAIGTIVSIVVLATRSAPGFTVPNMMIHCDSLRVESTLKKAFPSGLDEIIKSGSEVGIYYTVELFEKDEQGLARSLFSETFGQYIAYSPGSDEFVVSLVGGDELTVDNLDSAKILITNVGINTIPIDEINSECDYQVSMMAALNAIEIEAIGAESFDLNAFWNFKYPMKNSRWIAGAEIAP